MRFLSGIGSISGIAAGALVVLAVLIGLIIWRCRKTSNAAAAGHSQSIPT